MRWLLIFFVFFGFFSKAEGLNSDGLSLLALKSAIDSDPTGVLRRWSESDATPCRWPGVVCTSERVTDLYLPNKALSGYIPSELGRLDKLKRLGLARNNFSKSIPGHLFQAQSSLVVIDLSQNSLSGPIPTQIGLLNSTLRHLDLSSNNLTGALPESIADLRSLVGTLNFSFNSLSGQIPASYGRIPVFVSLDLRRNNLTGEIPRVGSLLNQGPTAFAGNPGLCGFPLEIRCSTEEERKNPSDRSDDPPQKPLITDPNTIERSVRDARSSSSSFTAATVPIVSGITAIVGVASVTIWLYRRRLRSNNNETENEDEKNKSKSKNIGEGENEGQNGKFVAVDEGFGLELEDLLRASAYVVGKSRSGIVYRVVAGTAVVAVRRLSEESGDATWRLRDFEAEIESIGGVNHPNIVRLRAYYFAPDEKLLVTDFLRNGSLYAALHGDSSEISSSPRLSWSSRLKIAQGTARGLMYIHEHSHRKPQQVHGSLKSTKILLDDDLQAQISGFGLTRLVTGSKTPALILSGSRDAYAYLAPESRVSGTKLTQKCDVYSFGVVLLELLTGKMPGGEGKGLEGIVREAFREEKPLSEIIDPSLLAEVHAKKQVVAAFHVALNCTEIDPEIRPRMRTVSESLDRIRMQWKSS